ncbi:DUF3040 domain-containing protein [Streptomyces cavernae]|uniref:DUF3040 domain-containing protein n=1 Tax=Streptomyces cavernae TaxID=2259034 RepID=UPI001EE483DD|nr:DUF3040 domain-containing protein [Streptomyces cavernae]
MDDMNDIRLSPRERIILRDIESALRRDRRLVRAMRPPRPSHPPRRPRPPRHPSRLSVVVALLAMVSILLIVVGIRTSEAGVIWAFAALWPLTLVLAFRLLCRWTRHGEVP